MQTLPKRYPAGQRERAVKMVLDYLDEYQLLHAAGQARGPKFGIGPEFLRNWTKQAQIDAQQVSGANTEERQRIKASAHEMALTS